MNEHRHGIKNTDEFDILSAIWILACNDENPIMSYEGIKYRLGLPESYDLRSLIQNRGELFRIGVPKPRLEIWKQRMLQGKKIPAWLKEYDGEARVNKINSLSPEDVFRSQFRAGRDAAKSPIEILDWGIQHIDRLRKANLESRQQSAKRWEIWLVFGVGIANMIIMIVLALLS